MTEASAPRTLGRYVLYGEIASGGMATVHFGRLVGPVGFSRTVAIKRMHPHLARDPELVAAFLDEARLAARINHPNVVQTLDVVATDGELFLVMDYVQGESLSRLCRAAWAAEAPPSVRVLSGVMLGALAGLHAAHEAKSDRGESLGLVHRDVSPQNILVGADGVARVLDFGVAKATGRVQQTRSGELKGKLPYMAPEQVRGERVDRRTDVFAASVVLWEALTGEGLFHGEQPGAASYLVLTKAPPPPSALVPELPKALDAIVLRGLEKERERRFPNALEMALALEAVAPPASALEIGAWVRRVAGRTLEARARAVAEIESGGSHGPKTMVAAAPGELVTAAPRELATVAEVTPEPIVAVAPPVRRRVGFIVAGATVSLATAGVLVFARGRAAPPSEPAQLRAAAPVVEPAPAAARPVPVATPPLPAVEPPAPARAVARQAPRVRNAHVRPPPAPRPEPIAAPAPVHPEPSAPAGCENPFIVDRDGTKRPRPECFK